jgi:hypothetical protein
LCAETTTMSASGSGTRPADCEQSARNSPPAARTCASAGVPSCGISTVPVSELTDWTATIARPGRASASPRASPSTCARPFSSLPSGTTSAPGAARNTASCSAAETSRRSAFARPRASASASLAPEVKITSPLHPNAALIRARASSSAARAARPSACGLDGLAQISQPCRIASAAAGRRGVVAA